MRERHRYPAQLGPLTRACYDEARKRHPDLQGMVSIRYLVVGAPGVGGIVDDIELDENTLDDDEFATCVRESVMSLTFDRAPDRGGYKEAGFEMEWGDDASPP